MSLRITVEPVAEPIDLAEARRHLRLDDDDDEDDLVQSLILTARKYVEQVTWLQLVTATYEWKLDRLCGVLYVPRPPLQSVASIQYVDAQGNTQTLGSSLYTVDAAHLPGRILPAYNQTWPTTRGHIQDATITFDAGYGDAASDVPEPIRQAMLVIIGHLYENRGGCDGMPASVGHLLSSYRVYDTRVLRHL
jgi:uncharacterized phiE125 gp8 family phage protein